MIMRLIRLYGCFLRFEFSVAFQFRFDLCFRVLMDVAYFAMMFSFFKAIFLHTETLGGWSEEQVLIFTASLLVSDGIYMALMADAMYRISPLVNRGQLDYLLVRPVSAFFFATLRHISVNSFINTAIAFGLLAYCLSNYTGTITVVGAVGYSFLMVVGLLIYFFLRTISACAVFWAGSNDASNSLFYAGFQFTERPHTVLKGWARRILTTAAPFAVIASFPVAFLFEPHRTEIVWHMLGVLAYTALMCFLVWRAGLARYSSASS